MEKSQYDALEGYLAELRRLLPPEITSNPEELAEIMEETVTHILDQAEDLAGRAQITNAHIKQAIKKFGSPENIANDYKEVEIPTAPQIPDLETGETSHIYETLQQEALQLAQQQRKREILNFIEWILIGNCQLPAQQRFSLVGHIFQVNPDYFFEKIYAKLQKILKKSSTLDPFEFDQCIIEKYSLLPGERIIAAYYGKILIHNFLLRGRIIHTNQRIIINGPYEPSFHAYMLYKMPWGGIEALNEIKAIQFGMTTRGSDKFLFGYQFKFKNVDRIKSKKNRVSFDSDFNFQKNYRATIKRMKVTITVEDPPYLVTAMDLLMQMLQKS